MISLRSRHLTPIGDKMRIYEKAFHNMRYKEAVMKATGNIGNMGTMTSIEKHRRKAKDLFLHGDNPARRIQTCDAQKTS